MQRTEAENSRRCPSCDMVVAESVLGGQCPRCTVRVLRRSSGGEANQVPPTDSSLPIIQQAAPRYFGDYELMSELGRGGMGIVYRARQLTLNRNVAVKLIVPERLNSPKAVERFHAEAEATANLDHPNIVPIYETGEVEGRHYFSMKLIEGQTLAQQIGARESAGAASPDSHVAAAVLLAKVASAVHYAHQCGILHRDLKPGNILIGDDGEPHVADFGLAKCFDWERSLSLSGEVLGTPAYMAPEQAMGKASQTTTATDVYSLGAILYEMLTGRAPFRAETPMAILEAVLHHDAASPRLLEPTVPRDLETICLRCLEKEPSKRYGSAQAVAEELHRFLRGEPIQARPVTQPERAWRWCRRNPALASALTGMALAAVAGLAGVLWQWHRARINAAEARANLYAADMNLVQQALAADNLRQAVDLLHQHLPKGSERDLRGFEWRLFWQQTRSEELFSLSGHERSAICVAFSPDGLTLATGGFDRQTMIWDLLSRRVVATLPHPDQVQSVSFSPRGDILATGSGSAVYLWDAKTYQRLRTLDQAAGKVSFSPDGHHLVTTSAKGLILWNTGAWSIVKTLEYSGLREVSSDGVGFGIAFSPDSTRIALVADDGIKLFNVPDLEQIGMLPGRMPRWQFVAFSPDGHTLAASTPGHDIKLWNVGAGREVRSWPGHSDSVFAGKFSPDGNRLATCSADQTLKLWNVTNGELIRTFKGHTDELWDVVFSADGKLLASVGKDGAVKIWDAERKLRQDSVLREVDPLGFSSDGYLMAVTSNSMLVAYDPESHQQVSAQGFLGLGPQRPFRSLLGNLFSDGQTAGLFDPSEKKLEIWDLRRRQVLCSVESQHPHASFAPKAQLLATATSNNTVTVWQMPRGLRKWVLTNSTPPFVLSPDGAFLAAGAQSDQRVRLWKLGGDAVRQVMVVRGDDEHRGSLAFSPDGRMLAVGTWEGVVRLLEMPTGQQASALVGHKRAVTSLSFSPDGQTLATVSDDSNVRLWHLATQREIAKFQELGDNKGDFSLLFSPDGRALAAERTRSDQDITRLWYAPSFAEIADAEAKEDSPVRRIAETPKRR